MLAYWIYLNRAWIYTMMTYWLPLFMTHVILCGWRSTVTQNKMEDVPPHPRRAALLNPRTKFWEPACTQWHCWGWSYIGPTRAVIKTRSATEHSSSIHCGLIVKCVLLGVYFSPLVIQIENVTCVVCHSVLRGVTHSRSLAVLLPWLKLSNMCSQWVIVVSYRGRSSLVWSVLR